MCRLATALLGLAAAVGLIMGFTADPANATLACTTTITVANGQTVADTSLGTGVCLLAADKLYGNFTFGNLPGTATGDVRFSWSAPSGGLHSEQFDNPFLASTTYNGFGFEVLDQAAPGFLMTALTGDFDESNPNAANSVLTKTTDASGSVTCNRPNGTCPQQIALLGKDMTDLTVSETLALGAGAVTGAEINTITETQVPEPESLALFGSALLALGLLPVVARTRKES